MTKMLQIVFVNEVGRVFLPLLSNQDSEGF